MKKKKQPNYEIYVGSRVVWKGDDPSIYWKIREKYPRSKVALGTNWAKLKGVTLIAKILL